jgi:hypothetical protein
MTVAHRLRASRHLELNGTAGILTLVHIVHSRLTPFIVPLRNDGFDREVIGHPTPIHEST